MKKQTVFRVNALSQHFTTISNALLQDTRLTHETKGLLCELLSRPTDWEITVRGIIASGQSGREKVYRMLKEAEKCGYIRPEGQTRDETGKLGKSYYVVSDLAAEVVADQHNPPCAGNPSTGELPCEAKPHTAQPYTANQPQQIKDSNKQKREQNSSPSHEADKARPKWEEDEEGLRGAGWELTWAGVDMSAQLVGHPQDQARQLARVLAAEWSGAQGKPPASAMATFRRALREEKLASETRGAPRRATQPQTPHWRERQAAALSAVLAASRRASEAEKAEDRPTC